MTDRHDIGTISKIADRGLDLLADAGIGAAKLDVMMDIEFAHEDTPMDLQQFLQFNSANFAHDFIGIYKYLDRDTKKLTEYFLPRCSLPKRTQS